MSGVMLRERLLKEYKGETNPYYSTSGEKIEVTYYTRKDPISGNVSKISEIRANRPIGISASLDLKPVEKCDFCDYINSTPQPRIPHKCGAVSIPNKFPWEKYDWNTIYPPFGKHKLLLSDLYFHDLECMIESSYDLAEICNKDEEVLGMIDFTNWGIFAGASQQHPHSQRKSITSEMAPSLERELNYCKEIAEVYGTNPFSLLFKEDEEDGRRIIYKNDVIITAAFAPSCPSELLLYPREEISNILQIKDEEERKRIIRPALGAFQGLFFYAGVTDLNIAIHMAPFRDMEGARKYYRWHMHIYPRRPHLPVDKAGAELGFETGVIDITPEKTAEILRLWYNNILMEDLLVKGPDGTIDPNLKEDFYQTINNCKNR